MLSTLAGRTLAVGALLSGSFILLAPAASSAPSRDPANGAFAVRGMASTLNVRSAPGTSSGIIGTIPSGQVYVAVARSGEWYKIWFNQSTGWCHGDWLADDSSQVVVVTASALNVRSGASTANAVIGQASNGQRFAVRASSGVWRRINFGGRDGWVHSQYLTTNGATTPAPTTPTPTPTNPSRPVSAAGFIQLPPSGPGFYCYYTETRRWGVPRFVNGIERVARRFMTERPSGVNTRLGIGDISAKNGGKISGHASHQRGVDGDFRLPRTDGQEIATTRFMSAYSRAGTQKLVNLFRAEMQVTHIFFNDPNVSGVSNWPNHDNHFHVRIR